MNNTFETFKPKSSLIKPHVDYYYLDIKPDNEISEFQCFPHFNNTISLYKSHTQKEKGHIIHDEAATALQIFTPIREKALHIIQSGKVHRIVIVFHPLGIQQFYRPLNFADYITHFEFFSPQELNTLFSMEDPEMFINLLDSCLEKRFSSFENTILEQSIQYIFSQCDDFTVAELSDNLSISRQHLNRNFRAHLGVSVKKFHEIVLFRKTVNEKLFENPDRNFTELAHEFNYNDQSHFNKAYKNFTENSPKRFFDKGTILGNQDTFWCLQP